MLRSLRAVVVSLALILLSALPQAASAGVPSLRADLDGAPIPLSSVSLYHCHDFAFPAIHCYQTEAGLDAAVATTLGMSTGALQASPLGWDIQNYVEFFDYPGFTGASIFLSADYANLSVIGWNDRVSSYAASYIRGAVFVDAYYSGAGLLLCCNQIVPSLSSTFDNRISSAERI